METLFDTFSALCTSHYMLVLVSVIGIIVLCVTMKPDVSYFTGSRKRVSRGGEKNT